MSGEYGEPWTAEYYGTGDDWVRDSKGNAIFPISYNQDQRTVIAARIVACVSALDGIANPAALKPLLEEVHGYICCPCSHAHKAELEERFNALAALHTPAES